MQRDYNVIDDDFDRNLSNAEIERAWERFFQVYKEDLKSVALSWPDETSIKVDWWELDKSNPDLAEEVIEDPNRVLDIAERVVDDEVAFEGMRTPDVRVENLGEAYTRNVEGIRVADQKTLVQFDGMAQQATEVMAKMLIGAYECRACGNTVHVEQTDPINEQQPNGCGQCEKRSKFDLNKDKSTFVDAQKVTVQDLFDRVPNDKEPGQVQVWLEGDLAGEVKAGQMVRVVGIIDSEPRIKGSKRTTTRDFYCRAVNVKRLEDVEMPDNLSEDEIQEWRSMAQQTDFLEHIAQAVAPGFQGNIMERVAIALSLVGGCGRSTNADHDHRGDIHLLLIGDPGLAKSALMRSAKDLVHGAAIVDAKNASKSGLTATVVRDDWTGRWALDLGAMPLTDRSICFIDELDKARKREIGALHEPMEQQTCSVSKAGITASIPARSTVIASANPEHGVWEDRVTPADQLDLPGTILSRFDMILPFFDEPDAEEDEELAEKVIAKAQGKQETSEIDRSMFRRVIQHARDHISPTLTDEAAGLLQKDYVETRKRHSSGSVAITPRQLEAMVRLAQAHARLCLREQATVTDAEFAIDMTHYWLDRLTSQTVGDGYDISLIEVGHGASQRERVESIRAKLDSLQDKANEEGRKAPKKQELISELSDYGGNEAQLEADLDLMKREGELYEPEPGLIRLL